MIIISSVVLIEQGIALNTMMIGYWYCKPWTFKSFNVHHHQVYMYVNVVTIMIVMIVIDTTIWR